MLDTSKSRRAWSPDRVAAIALTGTLQIGGGLFARSTAGAKTASNTFTFKGAYSGTLKLSPSSFDCSFGKTYNP